MAYASTWRRDGVGAEPGGTWRRWADAVELCVIPGCSNLVGAQGDGCADCRLAYGDRIGFGERTRSDAECWLCGGPAVVTDASCGRCADAVDNPGRLAAARAG